MDGQRVVVIGNTEFEVPAVEGVKIPTRQTPYAPVAHDIQRDSDGMRNVHCVYRLPKGVFFVDEKVIRSDGEIIRRAHALVVTNPAAVGKQITGQFAEYYLADLVQNALPNQAMDDRWQIKQVLELPKFKHDHIDDGGTQLFHSTARLHPSSILLEMTDGYIGDKNQYKRTINVLASYWKMISTNPTAKAVH